MCNWLPTKSKVRCLSNSIIFASVFQSLCYQSSVIAIIIIGIFGGITSFFIWIIVVANRARREILEDGEMLPISQPHGKLLF